MDPNYLIDEPNKVAEVYRNYRPTVIPFEVERRLEFIDIAEDGYTILGSSNLSGRYWRGSVWYFKNASLAPLKENCETGIECDHSVSDGRFLNNKKTIIIGEDSGAVTVYELVEEEESVTFNRRNTRHDHDSCVVSISVSSDGTNAVSASMDLCIKVWDTNELVPAHTFRCAHSHHITSVAYSSDLNSNIFGSCGLDGAALLWDTRQSKPATVLIDDPKEGLTALAWQAGESNTLIVGSAFGNISVFDVRSCTLLKQSDIFNRSVYKLLSIERSLLAACADSHEVKVIDPTDDLTVRYIDERHSDFVRGLSYDKTSETLFSCGWDKKVISHVVKP